MIKILITAGIALLVGIIAATSFLLPNSDSDPIADKELIRRIENIESRLNEEVENRLLLERQLQHEHDQRMALAESISELNGLEDALTNSRNSLANQSVPNNFGFQTSNNEKQLALLTDNGFSEGEAERILELESNVQQALMNARFGNVRVNPRELILENQKTMRTELGDDQYELYLETTGRPTSVEVASIVENSAGQIAGLQSGDQIISYDGERVFSILDLQESTSSGTEGQTVTMEVLRDGSPTTLAIPRGQIGISTGGFGRGFGRQQGN